MEIVRFIKNWTLPTAITSGVVIYLIFHFVEPLRPIAEWYAPYNSSILPDFMFLILFVTFSKVNYNNLRPVKWHLWLSVLQLLFVAAIMLISRYLGISGEGTILTQAVLVCVVSPVASAAAVVTAKLGGNLEEMTSYTFVSNFLSALLIPLLFPLLTTGNISISEFIPLFTNMLWRVSVVLLIPMLIAYIVKRYMNGVHAWIVGVKDLSYYLWGASLVVVTATTMMNIFDAWEHTSPWLLICIGVTSLGVCVIQFAIGRYVGRYNDKVIETGQGLGQKNTAFAIWVATAFLHPLSSVGPGCYILWQNIINSIEIWHYRKRGEIKAS